MLKNNSRHFTFIVSFITCITMIGVFSSTKDDWGLKKKDLVAIYPSLGVGALASLIFLNYSYKSDKSFKIFDMLMSTAMSAAVCCFVHICCIL